jgi:O-antigen/teichoic acid export membrane protein
MSSAQVNDHSWLREIYRWIVPAAIIRRNLQFKFASEIVVRGVQFAFIIVAARRLGVTDFGVYAYGVALGFVFAQICDFGLQILVTREIARAPSAARAVLGTTLLAKGLLFLASCTVLVIFVRVFEPPTQAHVVLLLAVATMLTSFVEFFNYAFRGFQRLEFEAALNISQRLLGPGLALLALWFGGALSTVAWIIFFANCAASGLGYFWLTKYFAQPVFQIKTQWLGYAVREVLPLGLAIAFSGIYARSGVLLLQGLWGSGETGLFNAAQRLTDAMQVFPAIALAAIFPAFAGERDAVQRQVLGWRTLGLLLLLAGILALAGWGGAEAIINLVYGSAYAASTDALRWLALTLVPMFLNYALTHFLIAYGRQWFNALFTFTYLVVNIGLGIWLIPVFGAAGAAMALMLSEIVLCLLCAVALARPSPRVEPIVEEASFNAK